jgi:GLPGLI family protein
MKKYFTISCCSFSLIIFSLSSKAQKNAYTITYEEKANIENQLKNVTDPETRKRVAAHLSKSRKFVLYIQGGTSLYKELSSDPDAQKKQGDKLSIDAEGRNVRTQTIDLGKGGSGVYKNIKENIYLNEINLFGKNFLIKDKLLAIDWQLLPETKKIGTLDCKKAKATVNGEDLEAWYAPSIPIAFGPSDYQGLPGLIVELHAPKKSYYAINVAKNKENVDFSMPSKGEAITREEFKKIQTEKMEAFKRDQAKMFGGMPGGR